MKPGTHRRNPRCCARPSPRATSQRTSRRPGGSTSLYFSESCHQTLTLASPTKMCGKTNQSLNCRHVLSVYLIWVFLDFWNYWLLTHYKFYPFAIWYKVTLYKMTLTDMWHTEAHCPVLSSAQDLYLALHARNLSHPRLLPLISPIEQHICQAYFSFANSVLYLLPILYPS